MVITLLIFICHLSIENVVPGQGAVSHEEDRACQALQTERPIYAETAIMAIETTRRGFDQCLTVQIRRQRALRPSSKALFKDVVWNAKQRSGLQGDRGACGGPGAPRLRHCWLGTISTFTTAETAGRVTFMTCEAALVIFGKMNKLNWTTFCFTSLTAPCCANSVYDFSGNNVIVASVS